MSAFTNTDAILHYNVGEFGNQGWAVPNPSNDPISQNDDVVQLVDVMGVNLLAIMIRYDSDLSTPPLIDTVIDAHQLYLRCRQIVASRLTPESSTQFQKNHVSPSPKGHRLHPVPYRDVRNPEKKWWAQMMLELMSECIQHTDNKKPAGISEHLGARIGAYMSQIYWRIAIELFGKDPQIVKKPDYSFLLTEADLSTGYKPSRLKTSVELIDTVPPLSFTFTEDQLILCREGIFANMLPDSVRPFSHIPIGRDVGDGTATGANASASGASPGFPIDARMAALLQP